MDNDSQPPVKSRKKDEVLGNVTAKSFDSAPMMMTADELAEMGTRRAIRLPTFKR